MHDSKQFPFQTLLLIAFAGVAQACGSDSHEPSELDPSQPASGAGTPSEGAGPGGPGAADTPALLAGLYLPSGNPERTTLHRLTQSELAHSLQDLLGDGVPIGELEPDAPVGGFAAVGASSVAVSPAGVNLHEQQVLAATGYVFADEARARALLPCMPASPTDSQCSSRIVAQFGRRAFRRPLTEAEIQRFTGLAATIGGSEGASALVGLRYALAAILESPSFIYRIELGAPSS
ncbi:MAG: DUF1595 domain-containing protein, partial [Deltaproteobacteria bacterium]